MSSAGSNELIQPSRKPDFSAPGNQSKNVRYGIITPVRNEAAHLQSTIDSVVAQSITPSVWVLVDDGSSDDTPRIIDAAAARNSWIKVIHRPDRGFRKSGGGVIEAFNEGYNLLLKTIGTPPRSGAARSVPILDFLVKLDGDLEFASDYFAQCFNTFFRDPRLGIGGGVVCKDENGEWIEEAKGDPAFHVRGATKIYRGSCWEALGGLVVAPGWDTLDELKANMLGWRTRTFRDIKLLQLKSTGTADGTWKNWVKNGRANYITGYHPLFMLAKCARRSLQRPYALAALGLFTGFITGYFKRIPQVPDTALVQYVRSQQLNRLLGKQSLWS
jgi:poly-beta-1,6-N-acetyl-D-glucosamine synthase